jgi:hypothetical protein
MVSASTGAPEVGRLGVGVGAGVACGAWLTVASGAGAPGVASLDTTDLVRLPASSAAAVFVVAMLVQVIWNAVVGRKSSSRTVEREVREPENTAECDRKA